MRFHHFCCSRVAFEIQRNFILVPQVSSKVHFPFTEDQKFYWSIYDSWWQHQMSVCAFRHEKWAVSKFRDLSVAFPSFLPHPPPPHSFTRTIFCTVFDSHSQFLAPKPHGNTCFTGSSLNHIFTPKFPKFSHSSPSVWQMWTVDWQVNGVNIVVECSNRFPIPKLDF